MTRRVYCDDATLIVGDRWVSAEVDLGVPLLEAPSTWGGILHRIPSALVNDLRSDEDVRLRLSDGQERRIRLRYASQGGDEEGVSVPFLGEGTAPF